MKGASWNKTPGSTLHRAGRVMMTPDAILENGWILVANGLVKDVGNMRRPVADQEVDHGSGLLTPALVNAHVHLELTALKNRVSAIGGFGPWVSQLLKEREAAGTKELAAGVSDGIAQLIAGGCGLIGDISSLDLSWEPLFESELEGVVFREFLGNRIAETPGFETCHDGRLRASVAGHGPHTTAPKVLVALKSAARRNGVPFSIHLDESEAERMFIATGKGAWADFLTQRGVSFAEWGLPGKNPVDHIDRLGLLDNKTIAVHLLGAGPDQFALLEQRGVHVCVCPRSNEYLHQRLPDLNGMLAAGLAPCLGTDSLASTPSLSMFDEMAFVKQHFPNIPQETIWAMATVNGARALGMEHKCGDLLPGKLARFAYTKHANDSIFRG